MPPTVVVLLSKPLAHASVQVMELYNGISAEFQQYMDKRKQEGSLPG